MRLNEGCIQISSQMVAKSLWEVPVLVLGLIFIEITRGPFVTDQSQHSILMMSFISKCYI